MGPHVRGKVGLGLEVKVHHRVFEGLGVRAQAGDQLEKGAVEGPVDLAE